ncbi:hypothetical protein V5735_18655 (plasmid) [Haladaptatus sp. SPP-AMP-3]|uniref:hypothetical protein n=1 Tax=Haladaptatus sp. SPP-AMP-3 TaxID=3121295 RepID=UPI003C2B0701
MSGTASAEIPYASDYGTVVNMVDDAGADPNEGDSITPLLREYADDDTLLYLPGGRYYMDEQFRFTGFNNFGIIGEDDTTIVPADYYDFDDGGDWNYRLFRLGIAYSPGRDLRFQNITVDQTADDTGVRVIETAMDDGLIVRDVTVNGQHDSGTWGPGRFVITDSNGEGLVDNFSAADGGAWSGNTPADQLWRGPTGIICNRYNKGSITFKDCKLGRFPDNGLYAANGSGQIIVDGGYYENSQTASIRIGGRDSIVKNATISVNESSGHGNQHAIRAENAGYMRIIDCDVAVSDPNGDAIKSKNVGLLYVDGLNVKTSGNDVCHALRLQDDTRQSRIKNSTFTHEASGGFSLWIQDGEDPVHVENSRFVGNGGDESARAAVRCDRDECNFRDLYVKQLGSSRRRALVNTGENNLVYKGEFRSEEYPIIDHGVSSWIEGVYANSERDLPGLRLTESASDTYVKKSHIVDGIRDDSNDVSGWGNDFSA